jgi:hypothetical protein
VSVVCLATGDHNSAPLAIERVLAVRRSERARDVASSIEEESRAQQTVLAIQVRSV